MPKFAVPHLMEIQALRAAGSESATLMNTDFAVPGLMELRAATFPVLGALVYDAADIPFTGDDGGVFFTE